MILHNAYRVHLRSFFLLHNKFSNIKLAFIFMWLLSPLKYTIYIRGNNRKLCKTAVVRRPIWSETKARKRSIMEAGTSMVKALCSPLHIKLASHVQGHFLWLFRLCSVQRPLAEEESWGIPPTLTMPGSASWDIDASAIGKDCHIAIYPSRLGVTFHFICLRSLF